MNKLKGKIALITGASEGIGFAIAQEFINEGIEHIFITGRRQDKLDEAIINLNYKNITAIQGNISNMIELDHLFNIIKKEKNHLDIIVANAGITLIKSLDLINENEFDIIFNINVKGTLFTIEKSLPLLNNYGSIIIIGSPSSIKPHSNTSIYSASKAAIRSFAQSWINELKNKNIRINILSPGSIETTMFKSIINNYITKTNFINEILNKIPIHRLGISNDINKVAVFLASNYSNYITGIELFVDGGRAQI